MSVLANAAIYQCVWFFTVIGAAIQAPWLGPLLVVIAINLHLRAARYPFEECLLIFASAVIGVLFDSVLVAQNWVSYPSGMFSSVIAPYWIVTLWMVFATTLNVSLRFLRGRPVIASAFGLFGGPLAYIAGNKLNAITLVDEVAALTALGIGWAVIMPTLVWIAERLDGMPGARRKWLAGATS